MKPIIIPTPIPGFQTQSIDGDLVLLNPQNNVILHINPTGALVWQLCDGQRLVSEIILILSEAYPEARAQIEVDVPKIIFDLVVQGALEKG